VPDAVTKPNLSLAVVGFLLSFSNNNNGCSQENRKFSLQQALFFCSMVPIAFRFSFFFFFFYNLNGFLFCYLFIFYLNKCRRRPMRASTTGSLLSWRVENSPSVTRRFSNHLGAPKVSSIFFLCCLWIQFISLISMNVV